MKKILITLAIIFSLAACEKEGKVCWECRTVIDGSTVEKCDNGSGQFTDAQGNDMQCRKIQ